MIRRHGDADASGISGGSDSVQQSGRGIKKDFIELQVIDLNL